MDSNANAVVTAIALPVLSYRRAKKRNAILNSFHFYTRQIELNMEKQTADFYYNLYKI